MAFLDHDGLVKVWSKMLEKVNAKADSSHDHNSISGTASNVTGVVSISNGGTGSDSRGGGYQALQSAGTISGNFNDITTPGVYWVDLRECTNVPPRPDGINHGILEVINNVNVYQRFTCFEYTMYIRTYANSTWQDWACIYSSKDVIGINNGGTGATTRGDALYNFITGGTYSGNINDLTTIGSYWLNLSNCQNGPARSGHGTMEVTRSTSNNYLQRFTFYNTGTVYYRTYTNSQWYDWKEIFGVSSTVPISSGGTGASNSFNAQMNLGIMHVHDIVASDQNDWRTKALSQILQNSINYGGGFQCGSIGWSGVQFGQYFATSVGSGDNLSNRILALIYNSAGTNYALEVWRCDGGVWNACGVNGSLLMTLPGSGYGTADQRPAAGLPGRIWFQKV